MAQVDALDEVRRETPLESVKCPIVVKAVASPRHLILRPQEPRHAHHAAADDVEPELHRSVVRSRLGGFLLEAREDLASGLEFDHLLGCKRKGFGEFSEFVRRHFGRHELIKIRLILRDLDRVVVPTPESKHEAHDRVGVVESGLLGFDFGFDCHDADALGFLDRGT